jgi:hypothetical protein
MSPLFDWMFSPAASPPPQLASLTDGFTVALPSCVEGSSFRGDFTVQWLGRPETEAADREKLRFSIFQHARAETRRLSAAQVATAEFAVSSRLNAVAIPPDSGVRRMTVAARLTADQQTRRAAEEWEGLQARLAVQRLNAQLEVERLRHLRDDIFAKPEVARTYWLDKHPTALDEVLKENFERVAERLTSGPQPSTLAVANVLREFLAGLGSEHKAMMMELLHKTLADFGRADLANRLPPDPGPAQ